jgi:hypothetical protein
MAWWTPFAAMTGLNLLSGQRLDQSLLNAGVNTATGNLINQIAPNFGVNMGDGLLSQETVNLGQPQGMASTGSFNPALRTGFQAIEPTRGMAETLARQTQNVTPNVTQNVTQNLGQGPTPAYRNINPALVADQTKIPTEQMYVDTLASKYRPPFESPQLGQSADYTGGGYSPSIMDRIGGFAQEGIDFVKENPLLAGAGALALYRGINPPERPVAPPQAPGISRGGAVALGQPLQVRRPR